MFKQQLIESRPLFKRRKKKREKKRNVREERRMRGAFGTVNQRIGFFRKADLEPM